MKKLYFVRHGLSVMNKQGFFSGRSETPLAPEGREQARLAGTLAKDLTIDLIVSSPQQRAYETAQIIAREIGYPEDKVLVHDLFVERAFGILEGTPYRPGEVIDGLEGVETGIEIIERAKRAAEWLRGLEADTILIVSHGSTGRALRHVLNPTITFEGSERFNNAQVVQLV